MNSTMQLYFIDLADKYFPSAKDLASSLIPVSVMWESRLDRRWADLSRRTWN
ncbi:hypothetical protein [Paenibacillus sp. MER TA 81-3]|uniref:hypothetical protein n=1 Tax=Paenibacillus sp. MER TA 81-3 TaxID=2939573 RepID=UPI002041854B|nr:hypothetical protein [Paenibacillus sp. MER TA 81-3]